MELFEVFCLISINELGVNKFSWTFLNTVDVVVIKFMQVDWIFHQYIPTSKDFMNLR